MNFDKSQKVLELEEKIKNFMEENIYPNEDNIEKEVEKNIETAIRGYPKIIKELKDKAKSKNFGIYGGL